LSKRKEKRNPEVKGVKGGCCFCQGGGHERARGWKEKNLVLTIFEGGGNTDSEKIGGNTEGDSLGNISRVLKRRDLPGTMGQPEEGKHAFASFS